MEKKGPIRLSKVLADRGFCSRREADVWIAKGWVMVNGEVISTLGTKIDPDALITLAPEARREKKSLVTILLNKPVGYVSSQPEKSQIPAIRLIRPENQDCSSGNKRLSSEHMEGLAVAGRLDIDSKGLLVFTQDGSIAKKIIGEKSDTEKEYLVRVDLEPKPDQIAKLRFGLSLDGKDLLPAKVEQLHPHLLKMILKEGKKRQIRRMCEAVGLKVVSLKRVRVGNVTLGNLPEGQWRFLKNDESF